MAVLDIIKGIMGNSTLRVLEKIMYFDFLRFSASPLDLTQIVRFSMRMYSSLTIISIDSPDKIMLAWSAYKINFAKLFRDIIYVYNEKLRT